MPPTTPPRKSPVGLIIGITAAVLVVIVIGLCAIVPKLISKPTTIDTTTTTTTTQNSNTPTVESTPTPEPTTTSSTSPSGNSIDPTAASIVTDAQMASSVDSVSAAPTNLTSTFKTYADIYVTFKLNNNGSNFSQNPGYVAVKYYADSTALSLPNNTPLTINQPAPGGFFKVKYFVSAQGAAELYWCQVSDCSDEKLAQVVTFTVTS
jgi:cytoskeletal protein RodZ